MNGWMPEHDAMLRELHPRLDLLMIDIAARINARHGTCYTARHISERSAALGLSKRRQPNAPKKRASEWWVSR